MARLARQSHGAGCRTEEFLAAAAAVDGFRTYARDRV